ncbi:hypothetical protein GN958_ATG04964 [Phytophthora infestans]|uniref:Uncharacterized protein n=1 Tax=Phytophthora infestans TaxID=4787 RepID=A0A8S9V2Y0_PHYIN|nr:hypothetical protein GN958_ATG04964 [Phytophthora infestans]
MDSMDGPDEVLVAETAVTASSVTPEADAANVGDATDGADSAVDVQKVPVPTTETAARATTRRRQSKLEEARTTHEVIDPMGPLTRAARRKLETERASATAPQDQDSVAVAEYEEAKNKDVKDVTGTTKPTEDGGADRSRGSQERRRVRFDVSEEQGERAEMDNGE